MRNIIFIPALLCSGLANTACQTPNLVDTIRHMSQDTRFDVEQTPPPVNLKQEISTLIGQLIPIRDRVQEVASNNKLIRTKQLEIEKIDQKRSAAKKKISKIEDKYEDLISTRNYLREKIYEELENLPNLVDKFEWRRTTLLSTIDVFLHETNLPIDQAQNLVIQRKALEKLEIHIVQFRRSLGKSDSSFREISDYILEYEIDKSQTAPDSWAFNEFDH